MPTGCPIRGMETHIQPCLDSPQPCQAYGSEETQLGLNLARYFKMCFCKPQQPWPWTSRVSSNDGRPIPKNQAWECQALNALRVQYGVNAEDITNPLQQRLGWPSRLGCD